MSGILGNDQLGDFLLGDGGEDSGNTFNGFGQARAVIQGRIYGQAQARILQVYQGYGQAQGNVSNTYQGYGQAQGYILPLGFGQAQGNILQTYFGFSQAQSTIINRGYGFGQTQTFIGTHKVYGQTQAYIVTKVNGFGQAQAYCNTDRGFGQSQGYIFNPYLYAQARAKITIKGFQSGLAQAYIREQPVGQAQALIDSVIKNDVGQAQAFICWTDTFTRVNAFGLGSDYTWRNWDSSFSVPEDSTYQVNGTKVINSPDNFDNDSYSLNNPVPTRGTLKFDFTTDISQGDFPYVGVVFGDRFNFNTYGIVAYRDEGQWYLSPNWNAGTDADDLEITVANNKTYTVKFSYTDDGRFSAKIWETELPEPDWMVTGTILQPEFFDIVDNIWLDFYFGGDIVSFDNLNFCAFEPFMQEFRGSSQAQAVIHRTQGYGQATGQIVNTTANGNAQAYIAWTSVTSRFHDTFTRTTNRGLGSSNYLWSNAASSVDHPAATSINIDGSRVVVPANKMDSYWLGYTFGYYNTLEFEVIITAVTPFRYDFVVSGSPEFTVSFFYNSGDTLFRIQAFWGASQKVSGGFSTSLGAGTYKVLFKWHPSQNSVTIFRNGSLVLGSSGGGVHPNNFGNTNLLIKLNSGSTTTNLDNLVLDTGNYLFGQARAKIKAVGVNRHGQAKARIKGIEKRSGQAQAIINQGMAAGQAQAFIGDQLRVGYGQSQARISITRRGHGQVRAWIKIFRWKWGQAQGYITPRIGIGQVQAYILAFAVYKHGQAQAHITTPLGFGQAVALIEADTRFGFGQARTRIAGALSTNAQALATIADKDTKYAQAQASVVGYISRCGQAQGYIKRTIAQGNAQGFIFQPLAGNLVRFNGYLLPGYLQEENLSSPMRINIIDPTYADPSQEYIGLENKIISLRLMVVQGTYQASKEKVLLAGSLIRSARDKYVPLTVIDTTKHYLARTQKIVLNQTAGLRENAAEYSVEFEVKPWQYGTQHSLIGTTLLDTNSVNRTIGNGTWTPATIIISGNSVTVSGYTETGQFTGFVSVSGEVNNMVLDSENYTVTMAGENRNDLLNTIDHKIMIGPGRTFFTVNGATSCEIIYQDRWPL